MIPEEIEKKIDGYLQAQKCHVSSDGLGNIRTDILYGYSLAEARIKELESQMADSLKLYECQNNAVIKRDERIKELEARIEEAPATATYPAPFIEWVFENCILLEGSWYMWKIGEKKFTLAELFAGPYQTGQNNRGIIMVTDPLDNSVNMITAGSPEPMHIASGVDDTRAKVLADVNAERNRQHSLHGEQNHTPAEWLAILGEEFGEVCKAVFEARHNGSSLDNYREELVQVAAVAVQMIECYDRNKITNP